MYINTLNLTQTQSNPNPNVSSILCFKRAVDRNKIKRRIKAALHNLNINAKGNYLVIYKSLSIMPYKEIEKTLSDILNFSN